jgi:ribosomal protein S18 acetylase RimI-like enzyme
MRALLDEAGARGVDTIFLEVRADNEVALGLYERLGFEGYQLDPAMGTASFMQKWLVD